jgi:hypothetical protein
MHPRREQNEVAQLAAGRMPTINSCAHALQIVPELRR